MDRRIKELEDLLAKDSSCPFKIEQYRVDNSYPLYTFSGGQFLYVPFYGPYGKKMMAARGVSLGHTCIGEFMNLLSKEEAAWLVEAFKMYPDLKSRLVQ